MSLAVFRGIPARFRIGTSPEGIAHQRTGIPKVIFAEVLFPQILPFVPLDLGTGSP
jgi:hypothetical protein